MSRIVLGVAGGIAAYKACELLRRLQGAGHEVTVVPTAAALEFVGASTWACVVRPTGAHRQSSTTRTWCRTSSSDRRPTWSSLPLPPPICWPGPRQDAPTTC